MQRNSRSILAENIKRRRQQLGLTQQQLADRLNARQPYVARLERGNDVSASLDKIDEIAEALGVTTAELLTADIFSPAAA